MALSDTEDRADLQAWVAEFGVTHLVAGDYHEQVYEAYDEVGGKPQYAVIDRDGLLVVVTRDEQAAFDLVVGLL